MPAWRRSMLVVLTLVFTAFLSSFAWSEDRAPHSFRVEVSGHGRPMILIPGLASSGDTWKTTVARYRDRYECHVLTLAGFAGVPPIGEPLMTAVRAELATYIHDRHLDHPVIVGHSLGGSLALAVAVDHPEIVGPLVVVDMVPFLAGTALQAISVEDARPRIAEMRARMTAMTGAQWVEYARSGESVKYMVTAPTDLATIAGWSAASNQRAVVDALADVYGLDLRGDVAKIRTPVLALMTWKGVRDEVQAAAKFEIPRPGFVMMYAAQYADLPRLHFVLSDNARHFIMFDDPSWYFEQLDAFLRDPDASVRARGFYGK
jgi:pimeloyl-ACP methyl ester carboxylesterase